MARSRAANWLSGEDEIFLRHLRLKGFKPSLERSHVMPQPDTAYCAGGNKDTLFLKFIADSQLSVGRLMVGEIHHRLLNRWIYAVFLVRLLL